MANFSHHAYLIEGPLALLPSVAKSARALFGFPEAHSPDVLVQAFEKLGVEEAATLRQQAGLKSSSGKALFVVGFSLIMSEAQQALLKLLEEPQEGTTFVLLAPHGALLPTVRSRTLPYPEILVEKAEKSSAAVFLTAPYKVRSAQVASLLKEEGGERERVRAFLQELEAALYAILPKTNRQKEIAEGLSDIAHIRSYVGDRSPSLKMLLEHLALALPQLHV